MNQKERAKLRMMHRRLGTWKKVAEELQSSISTVWRYRRGRIAQPRGKLAERIRDYKIMQREVKGVPQSQVMGRIEKGGVAGYRYTEGDISQNRQYGILMELLTQKTATGLPKVNDGAFASDIANNIEKLPNIRGSLVTVSEMFENTGQLAARLTLQGFLPKHAKRIYEDFSGPVNFSNTAKEFIEKGQRSGILLSGQAKQLVMKSPLVITRIRMSYSFA